MHFILKPPQVAIAIPPTNIPMAKAISMAVKRHTSLPKVRVTCKGVKRQQVQQAA